MSAEPVGARVEVDLDHGGRWTSLRVGGREWLWRNPAVGSAQRAAARPGDDFVDAGGGEECWPTVRGHPDHGDVWSRSWSGEPDDASATVPGRGTLRRRISTGAQVSVDYTITGTTPFLHAVHLLFDLNPDAVITVPEAETMIVLDEPDPVRAWPSGLDRLGPDDGTAVCALLPGVHRAVITDGDDRLALTWDCPDRPDLCSLLLWRNLRGWPETGPYRSIGIEPMIGRAADLATAAPTELATAPLTWTLTLSAPDLR